MAKHEHEFMVTQSSAAIVQVGVARVLGGGSPRVVIGRPDRSSTVVVRKMPDLAARRQEFQGAMTAFGFGYILGAVLFSQESGLLLGLVFFVEWLRADESR